MNKLNLDNIGGLPFDQQVLEFMQDGYSKPLGALAQLCGDKTILYGVENVGGNITPGWISYNGELLPFVGAALAARVQITEVVTAYIFEDNNSYPVEYKRRAELVSSGGAFPFSDLQPLVSLKNIWKKDDLRMCKKSSTYIAANYDPITGIGNTPEEKGWQILSKQDVDAAGKTFLNVDVNDFAFSEAGYYGGEKEHRLTISEMPSHNFTMPFDSADDFLNPHIIRGLATSDNNIGTVVKPTNTLGNDVAHNNMQPYYVVLTLIKL